MTTPYFITIYHSTLILLITIIVVFNFNLFFKSPIWEENVCLTIRICNGEISNLTNMINFHPSEVVDRGSETQLQVGENVNTLT